MPKSSHKSVCNLFYGYQVDEIMRVCVVSKATAQHFIRGSRLPSPQAQRLWWLHIQGRILGSEWRRFRVHKDVLVDAAGNSYREGEIATIPLLRQQVSELESQRDKVRYAGEMGNLGFFEISEALRGLLREGSRLLEGIDKLPRRQSTKWDDFLEAIDLDKGSEEANARRG